MLHRFKIPLIVFTAIAATLLLWFGVYRANKTQVKRYSMTGTVISVKAESGTLRVHNDVIPGFMEPMEMDYTTGERSTLSHLKPGDNIRARLVSNQQGLCELDHIAAVPAKP